ncbi:MAG: DUF1294 domain-containing protein [Methanimicrococcus sp.]|nr:DUF1294 domain-containing protein [Methanimicrococcus sp.]
MVAIATSIALLLAIYFVLNLFAFAMYGFDKGKAALSKWRISEKTLLLLAVFGPFGAYAGMMVFRHKTKKKPFTWFVPIMVLLHVVIVVVLCVIYF